MSRARNGKGRAEQQHESHLCHERQQPGEAVTRRWLVEHVLDPEREGNERTLDAHMSRLRKKLGDACIIDTVWGIGYRLRTGEPS